MTYHPFIDHETNEPYGSFEVFHHSPGVDPKWTDDDDIPSEPGWYWVACFPGCLWDGEPSGPFASQVEALAAAQNVYNS